MLILRCVHLGELPIPLPGAGLSGSCLSCEALAQSQVQGETRRRNNSGGIQLSSPRVSSRSNYRSYQSTGAWMLRGRGALTCTARGHPAAGASLLPCVLLASVPGGAQDPGLCLPAPWTPGPVPLESRSPSQPPPLELLPEPPWSCS